MQCPSPIAKDASAQRFVVRQPRYAFYQLFRSESTNSNWCYRLYMMNNCISKVDTPRNKPNEATPTTQFHAVRLASRNVKHAPANVSMAKAMPQYWLMMNEQTTDEMPVINQAGKNIEEIVCRLEAELAT